MTQDEEKWLVNLIQDIDQTRYQALWDDEFCNGEVSIKTKLGKDAGKNVMKERKQVSEYIKPNANIKFFPDGWDMVVDADEIPADYVKVVRCKDCKYKQCRHYSYFCINENGKCYGLEVTEDFYCADGERKETE